MKKTIVMAMILLSAGSAFAKKRVVEVPVYVCVGPGATIDQDFHVAQGFLQITSLSLQDRTSLNGLTFLAVQIMPDCGLRDELWDRYGRMSDTNIKAIVISEDAGFVDTESGEALKIDYPGKDLSLEITSEDQSSGNSSYDIVSSLAIVSKPDHRLSFEVKDLVLPKNLDAEFEFPAQVSLIDNNTMAKEREWVFKFRCAPGTEKATFKK